MQCCIGVRDAQHAVWLAGQNETLVMQVARQAGWDVLNIVALEASTSKVRQVLWRINLGCAVDRMIPCCTPLNQLQHLDKAGVATQGSYRKVHVGEWHPCGSALDASYEKLWSSVACCVIS